LLKTVAGFFVKTNLQTTAHMTNKKKAKSACFCKKKINDSFQEDEQEFFSKEKYVHT